MSDLENNIILLHYPDNVRTRPGMYVGSTEVSDVILREIIDNSIDELMLPTSTDTIKININEETGECIVADNGRGIPDKIDEETGLSKLELAMSNLHAGGKFTKGKAASIGQNGVGSSCTNALSEYFEVWSSGLHIVWNKGIKVSEDKDWRLPEGFEGYSTVTRFKPDSEIFKNTIPNLDLAQFKFTELICHELGKDDIHIIVNGNEYKSNVSLPKFNIKFHNEYIDNECNKYPYTFSVYFDWELGRTYPILNGTVNGVHTPAGFHISWIQNHIKGILCDYFKIHDGDLFNLGLNLFVVVIASEVSFTSQTKEKLATIFGFDGIKCYEDFKSKFLDVVNSNREYFDKLKKSIDIYLDSAKRAAEVREINGLLQGTIVNTPKNKDRIKSKLSATAVLDCKTKNRHEAILYIVEGKSAMGTLVKARDPKIHSILPLRGKPFSAFKTSYQEMLGNREMLNLVLTIGGGIDKLYDISGVRYGKIVIAADSDPDGAAIAISLLGTIATHMRYLIDNGFVYVLEVPLYLDQSTGTYYYAGEESQVNFGSGKIRRFKGLGEFNAIQFRDIAFNFDKARLLKVTNENIEEALDLIRHTGPKKQLMVDNGYFNPEVIHESDFNSITYTQNED